MIDIRPVGYFVGWLVAALGGFMLAPMLADLIAGSGNGDEFATTAIITIVAGTVLMFACQSGQTIAMNVQQSFLLATGIWMIFPFFGALPFWLGSPNASFTDALFESMSALTTTS